MTRNASAGEAGMAAWTSASFTARSTRSSTPPWRNPAAIAKADTAMANAARRLDAARGGRGMRAVYTARYIEGMSRAFLWTRVPVLASVALAATVALAAPPSLEWDPADHG